MSAWLAVAAGGAIGATLRYAATTALKGAVPGFPVGTLAINVIGSFAMGVLAVVLMERMGGFARWAPFLLTGVLGGFTTFSAFSLDALYLVERGRMGAAALYVGGSVLLSVGALALGLWGARRLLAEGA
ncbi:MAG: fluoride efflux transporter CrcB [Pseudomonadota bacterium]